eukprot:813010-Prymnesium_polylepis.4
MSAAATACHTGVHSSAYCTSAGKYSGFPYLLNIAIVIPHDKGAIAVVGSDGPRVLARLALEAR